jgi:ectoine hydroxylase-related dioxygenase (phytanoyl-CoA dioxygenase family)
MSLITEKNVADFKELGYFVTPPAFNPLELAEVTSEFRRLWNDFIAEAEKKGNQEEVAWAKNRAFIGQTHTRSQTVARFAKSPVYLEACAKFLGPDADLYYNQAVIKGADKGKHFGWHQDNGYLVTKPLEYITCWTAIGDANLQNGCIWVLPKSHKLGLLPHPWNEKDKSRDCDPGDESGAIPVEMKAGQVAIFSSLLLHKSGPNTSNAPRFGYVPQYHYPHVVEDPGGKPTGDQWPVLRNGSPV